MSYTGLNGMNFRKDITQSFQHMTLWIRLEAVYFPAMIDAQMFDEVLQPFTVVEAAINEYFLHTLAYSATDRIQNPMHPYLGTACYQCVQA